MSKDAAGVTKERGAAKTAATRGALSQDQLDDLLDNLYEIYAKLDALDPASMSQEENDIWTEQYTKVTDAIRLLRNKGLSDINEALNATGDSIAAAINAAEDELHGAQDKVKILSVVGNVLNSIATIAALA